MLTNTDLHVVLGAGPAGSTLVAELMSRGVAVRHVNLSPIPDVPPGVEMVTADMSDPEQAVEATRGAVTVYHAINVPYHLQTTLMPGIGDAVLSAAARHGARLVVLDTLYPYGEAEGHAITEATPWEATSRKGRMRADLDTTYLRAHQAGTTEVVLGRSADFYGPRVLNSTLGAAFFPAALNGAPAVGFGDLSLPHSYSFLPDIAAGLADLGTTDDPSALGRVWHLPTVPAVSTMEIHHIVEDLTGHPVHTEVLAEPTPTAIFDALFMGEYAEMFYQHRIAQNMISTPFETRFGRAPTPLRDGLATTVDWFRDWLAGQAAQQT